MRMLARVQVVLNLFGNEKAARVGLWRPNYLASKRDPDSGSASYLGCFSENPASVESIINDFSDRGNVRIDVHPVTSSEMAQDPFGCNLQGRTAQL